VRKHEAEMPLQKRRNKSMKNIKAETW